MSKYSGREQDNPYWKHWGGEIPKGYEVVICRKLFSIYRKLVGYVPICGWLGITTAFIKWRATVVISCLDDEVTNHWKYDHGHCYQGTTRGPHMGHVVCQQTWVLSMDQLKLPCNWTIPRVKWGCSRGCMLVAVRNWHSANKHSKVGHCT